MHNRTIAIVVGISPDFWNVEGRLSIAGPVKELTIMAMLPSIPIFPGRAVREKNLVLRLDVAMEENF